MLFLYEARDSSLRLDLWDSVDRRLVPPVSSRVDEENQAFPDSSRNDERPTTMPTVNDDAGWWWSFLVGCSVDWMASMRRRTRSFLVPGC
ncbi:hypothetical protein B0T16DRAFT_92803 [Cercophora newfieldiana]|uniref:Uncharacterized protein n=1 Tax=Cercophora newfieldiana TaxID=92897 RepID=A0AA39YJ75_9PEZI|nr:hypothetical protein B0T16DRAFT_92803 [Cercophora newfieldiana]